MAKKRNENLKISVLIPVYNAAKFINECIDSIILQSEGNWEIICVDDFSNDNSFRLIEDYQLRDPRIKILKNTRKGIIPALKLALENATGTLITRMDADDKMHPDKLKDLSSILKDLGHGYCATALVEYFPKEELLGGFEKYSNWLNELTSNNSNYSEIYKECVVPSPCWMMYKSDLIKCGSFNSNQYPEDYDLIFRMYKYGIIIKGIPKILHYWRDHDKRASRNDPNYSDQSFLHLKLPYFLELDRDITKSLFLWGAGKKGKALAKLLQILDQKFRWVSNNTKKIGHKIYDIEIESYEVLDKINNHQVIVSISGPDEKSEVIRYCNKREWIKNRDYFMFY